MGTGRSEGDAMTPEDTPRMAERTDRQAQIDPWDSVHEEFADMSQWETARVYRADAVDAARAADAALLRERDAQIASLTAQVEQQTQGYTLKGLSNYFGWGLESDRDVWQFAASREHTLRLAQELLETSRSDAGTAADAIRDRIDTLRAERDAAQQAHSELASLVGAALVYATLDSEAGEKPTAEPDHALTETVWKLVQQRGRMESALATVRDCIIALTPGHRTGYDWNTDPLYLTRKEGQALAAIDAALSSSPRPQEPQP